MMSDTVHLPDAPLRLAALMLTALAMLAAVPAAAQTPVAHLEDADGNSLLHVNEDGSFALFGAYDAGVGTLPTEGMGARLMWYPEKAAFRVGSVGEAAPDAWDEGNLGMHSMALGRNTTASGNASTAMGFGSQATGFRSTAMGNITTADGNASTAMGRNTVAGGNYSTAMGEGTTASGNYSTAMGEGTTASGTYSTAMGYYTRASGNHSTAMGDHAKASGDYSTAIGNNTIASGLRSTAMGYQTTAATAYSLSAGKYNDANRSNDGTLFVVGNGSFGSRSDALVLDQSGNLEIAGSLTESSDRHLKTSIEPLHDGVLGRLETILPVRYRFREGTGHPVESQLGLIAQEVRRQFPELVSEGSSGYLSVSYSKFTAVLLKGIQEQQMQIEEQRVQIDALRDRVLLMEGLQARIARLEADPTREADRAAWSSTGVLLLCLLLGGLLGTAVLRTRRR